MEYADFYLQAKLLILPKLYLHLLAFLASPLTITFKI